MPVKNGQSIHALRIWWLPVKTGYHAEGRISLLFEFGNKLLHFCGNRAGGHDADAIYCFYFARITLKVGHKGAFWGGGGNWFDGGNCCN